MENTDITIKKYSNGLKIWIKIYTFLIFAILIVASAIIYIFISDYQFLIYINIPNIILYVVSMFFAVKFSEFIKKYNDTKNDEFLIAALKYQRNYFITLSAYVILITLCFLAYILFLFLYVRGMK